MRDEMVASDDRQAEGKYKRHSPCWQHAMPVTESSPACLFHCPRQKHSLLCGRGIGANPLQLLLVNARDSSDIARLQHHKGELGLLPCQELAGQSSSAGRCNSCCPIGGGISGCPWSVQATAALAKASPARTRRASCTAAAAGSREHGRRATTKVEGKRGASELRSERNLRHCPLVPPLSSA